MSITVIDCPWRSTPSLHCICIPGKSIWEIGRSSCVVDVPFLATFTTYNKSLGVVNNFGSPANESELDLLSNSQINMVINRNGLNLGWGNFTCQLADNLQKFTNVTRLIIFIEKSLRPVLENFLEEPNDTQTFKQIFRTVEPFLERLLTERALFSYTWNGDQNANSLDDLQVNDKNDVLNGKYKVDLIILPVPSLQEITINVILSAESGVSFT